MALTKALEQISQEYRREYEQEKEAIITKDNALKRIKNSQKDTGMINIETEFDSLYQEYINTNILFKNLHLFFSLKALRE